MAVGASARGGVSITHVPTTGDFSGQSLSYGKQFAASFTDGTNAGQADRYGVGVIDFTASNAQTINVQTDLVDITGSAFNAVDVTVWAVSLTAANASASVTIAPAGTNGWTALYTGTGSIIKASTNSTRPSYSVTVATEDPAYVVTNSNKQLTITPSAHASSLTIVALGRSA